jgi:hypothetical protein
LLASAKAFRLGSRSFALHLRGFGINLISKVDGRFGIDTPYICFDLVA